MKAKLIKILSIFPSLFIIMTLLTFVLLNGLFELNSELDDVMKYLVILLAIFSLVYMLVIFLMAQYYISNVILFSKHIGFGTKALWTVLLWFLGFIFVPLYWNKYIKEDD
ncbi:hypothetical protein [Petrocella sp. FN5]|uniref:hypothetical protein n=1 Tax=Petrocella sp. FN5 TaxID=3032002 RepID=UPI0023DAE0CC|nr:hypothetical protein [Petrocella sp. FN5]MDF1617294.1 hypothetical protein [Petrocella sp. FN5]